MKSARAALAAALVLPAPAWGQDVPRVEVVTEAEFLALPEGESPAFRALREEVGLARAEALAARTLQNPRLAASREAPASATEQLDFTISWEPPRPDRRRLVVAASDAGVAAAQSRLDLGEMGIRLAMREAFARWAVAVGRTGVLASFAERLESLARTQRRRAEAGEVSGLDARRMSLAAAQAKAELARSEGELASARAAALAWRPDLGAGARPLLTAPPSAPAFAAAHPELSALEAELAAARLERDLAERVLGLPGIVAGWQRQRSSPGLVSEGPLLGLEWPLPLFDRGRAERARAQVRLDAIEARLELARRRLSARREGALAAYELLRAAVSAAVAVEEGAEPIVAAATASFLLGETSLTDVLETLRSTSTAQLQALELRDAALEAHRELERLAGSLPAIVEPELRPRAFRDPASFEKESADALHP